MSLRELAREIYRVEQLATSHATSPQLGYSSTDSGIDIVDADGNTVGTVGRQDDGGVAVKPLGGPTPPAPSTPIVDWEWGIIHVRWDGGFTSEGVEADGSVFATSDLACIDVYASTSPEFVTGPDSEVEDDNVDATGVEGGVDDATSGSVVSGDTPVDDTGTVPGGEVLVATIYAPPEGGASTAIAGMRQSGEWYVRLVARSTAGKVSEPSETATVMVGLTSVSEELWESWIRAEDALETADGKNTVHGYGGEQPPAEDAKDGDLWFDDDHVPHKFDEFTGEWVTVTDARITALQEADAVLRGELETVRESAKGDGSRVHYSASRPDASKARAGDVWFDTSLNDRGEPVNRVHVFDPDKREFVYVADERLSRVESAQGSLNEALAGVRKSVDGKTSIRWEPKAPTGSTPGGVPGDTWHQYTGGQHVGTWRWDGSKWVGQSLAPVMIPKLDIGTGTFGELDGARLKANSVQADSVLVEGSVGSTLIADGAVTTGKIAAGAITAESGVVGSLDAGSITVGELDGARIKAGTVTADRVLIGSDRNMLPDGDLVRGGVGWPDGFTFDTGDKPVSCRASMATGPGSGSVHFGSMGVFPVEPGDTLVFECWLKADKPDSKLYVEVKDSSDNHLGGWSRDFSNSDRYPVGYFTVPTKWVKVTATSTVGEGVPAVGLGYFYFNHSAGSERDATVKLAGMKLYRKMGATVIADGAITTEKIAAGAITADSGVIGSLDASKITTGWLDGKRIRANTVASEQLAAGAVKAGILDANAVNGMTVTGATLRTSASNPRVELNDQGLFAYAKDGKQTFSVLSGTGDVSLIGSLSSDVPGARRVLIDNNLWANKPYRKIWGDVGYADATGIRIGKDGDSLTYGDISYAEVFDAPLPEGADPESMSIKNRKRYIPHLSIEGPGRSVENRSRISLGSGGSLLMEYLNGVMLRPTTDSGEFFQFYNNGTSILRARSEYELQFFKDDGLFLGKIPGAFLSVGRKRVALHSSSTAYVEADEDGNTSMMARNRGKATITADNERTSIQLGTDINLESSFGAKAELGRGMTFKSAGSYWLQMATGDGVAALTVGGTSGDIMMGANNVRVTKGTFYYKSVPRTGSQPNVHVNDDGWVARSSSSSRYKHDIQGFRVPDALLDVPFRTWIDKGEYERNGNSAEGLTRIPGLVAEEVAVACPELVVYDKQGRPDGLAGDRIGMAALTLIRRQRDRISVLEERLTALEKMKKG